MKYYILQSLLLEGNLNTLVSKFQKEFSSKSYSDLSESERKALQEHIEKRKKETEEEVSKITADPTYKSWIYDIILNDTIKLPEDSEKTKELLERYTVLKRKPDFPQESKNILKFKSFSELFTTLKDYIMKNEKE